MKSLGFHLKQVFAVVPTLTLAIPGVVVLVLLFAAAPVKADSVTLTLSPVSGAPGSTVTVDGTITNNGSDTVFLNSESFTLPLPFMSGDNTDFFLNAPVSLAPGANSGSIALFSFVIGPGTPGGSHSGNFLDIVGGGPLDFTDTLASKGFSVDVLSSGTAPEPSALVLLGTGLLGLLPLRRKNR